MRAAYPGTGLVVLALMLTGCLGQQVRGQSNTVEKIIRIARKNGAYMCAPKELALAVAHLERTRDELDAGNLIPAKDHLAIADKNARQAYSMSSPGRCVSQPMVHGDRDGDGCYDDVDKCPSQPEDKDGFEDADCCPDLDNDKDGILDVNDKCPNEPEDKDGFEDDDGCPDVDNDKDGILDVNDKCPNEPEDKDGFEDDDGCPDVDNDNDRIVDVRDKCPNEPEDYDGDADDDGCPDQYKLVVVTANQIELRQTVYFATNKTVILARSFPLLNEVAKVLQDKPTINVRIEGHTDSRGNDAYNLRLSQGRASSVRRYLMQRGIDPGRMEPVGYGETRPIANNQTRAGRAENRRVEFHITKQ